MIKPIASIFGPIPRAAWLAAATVVAVAIASGSASANTCGAELDRAQRQANAVSDPAKQQAVQALLQHAASEHVQGNEERCLSDVHKAEAAMSK
jgi:hypothetical protein